MKNITIFRPALSMIELIFVIVILGIVSSIGSEIIVQVYEGYIVQRAQYKASIKTELALNQIANRYRYAIPGTSGTRPNLAGAFQSFHSTVADNNKVLQWVAYDGDSFEAMTSTSRKPGWSGFCDYDASSGSTIETPGSNLDLATEIINNLGGSIGNARIFFMGESINNINYGIASGTGKTITLDTALTTNDYITERYKLAWSSYAVEIDDNNDLILHYNFAPTIGAPIDGSSSILLKNVTNFRFDTTSEGSIRIKICKEESIGDSKIHACKEKVVF